MTRWLVVGAVVLVLAVAASAVVVVVMGDRHARDLSEPRPFSAR